MTQIREIDLGASNVFLSLAAIDRIGFDHLATECELLFITGNEQERCEVRIAGEYIGNLEQIEHRLGRKIGIVRMP